MSVVFLDESGQFKRNNKEQYFIVASFTVGNQRRTKKQIKSWFKTRFPRKLRNLSEIKFSNKGISDILKLKTVKFISDLDVRIVYSCLLKKNIPYGYYQKDKLQSGLLYTNIIGETLDMYFPIKDKEFRVFCDKRHLKGLKQKEFINFLKSRIVPNLSSNTILQIEMLDSTCNANIQIADWIVGAIAYYYEGKKTGNKYYEILKNNIINKKELFKDNGNKSNN
jgi:hypothetical protein